MPLKVLCWNVRNLGDKFTRPGARGRGMPVEFRVMYSVVRTIEAQEPDVVVLLETGVDATDLVKPFLDRLDNYSSEVSEPLTPADAYLPPGATPPPAGAVDEGAETYTIAWNTNTVELVDSTPPAPAAAGPAAAPPPPPPAAAAAAPPAALITLLDSGVKEFRKACLVSFRTLSEDITPAKKLNVVALHAPSSSASVPERLTVITTVVENAKKHLPPGPVPPQFLFCGDLNIESADIPKLATALVTAGLTFLGPGGDATSPEETSLRQLKAMVEAKDFRSNPFDQFWGAAIPSALITQIIKVEVPDESFSLYLKWLQAETKKHYDELKSVAPVGLRKDASMTQVGDLKKQINDFAGKLDQNAATGKRKAVVTSLTGQEAAIGKIARTLRETYEELQTKAAVSTMSIAYFRNLSETLEELEYATNVIGSYLDQFGSRDPAMTLGGAGPLPAVVRTRRENAQVLPWYKLIQYWFCISDHWPIATEIDDAHLYPA